MEASGYLHAPTALTPGKHHGTHWIGGLVAQSQHEHFRGEKYLAPTGIPTAERTAHTVGAIPTELPWFHLD